MIKPTMSIKFSEWPWQACKPHWAHMGKTPKNNGWGKIPGFARFGGGWDWKLGLMYSSPSIIQQRPKYSNKHDDVANWEKNDKGIARSYWSSTVIINLIWGSIRLHAKTFFGPTLTERSLNINRRKENDADLT